VVAVNGQQWTLREAAALAQLSHPNVVTVFEVGTWNEHPWVAMEFVRGGTVRRWLAETKRTTREILELFVAAGRGLAAAHEAGIVHRDFKPDNVLVTPSGQPRVADFGLALELAKTSEHANLVMGTPAYMAPEQWHRGSVGPAADQFAFAVALWEALTGARPFQGSTEQELVEAFARPPAAPKRPLPRHVESALRRALSRDPTARWLSMTELLGVLAEDPQRARRRVAVASAAALVLVGAGVAVASLRTGGASADLDPPCARAAASMDPVMALRAKVPAVSDDRSLARLDAWLASWRADRTAACDDTYIRRTQPVALLQLRELCFDRARISVEASLHEIVAGADRGRIVDALPALVDCNDTMHMERIAPLPTEPAARTRIAELSATIARIEVLRGAGKLEQAEAELATLIPQAEATGRKDLIAEVWLTRGVMNLARKREGTRAMFETTAKIAAEAGDDRLVARAWMAVLDLLVARDELPNEAIPMAAVAEAAVLRAGNTPRLRADLAGTLGDIDLARGQLAAARAHYVEAIDLHVKAFGETQELARKLNRLASIETKLDEPDAARDHLRRAAELLQNLYGPRFKNLAVVWTSLGYLELSVGNWQASRDQFARAIALKEEANGKDAPSLVPTLVGRSQALSELDDFVAAEADASRAVEIAKKGFGPEHAKVVEALAALGHAQALRKDWSRAEATYLEAQRVQRKIGALPPLGVIELQLAKLAMRAKRFGDARAAVERARPIAAAQGEESYPMEQVLEIAGRIEHSAGKFAAARPLLEKALSLLEKVRGKDHRETASVRALLVSSDPAAATL